MVMVTDAPGDTCARMAGASIRYDTGAMRRTSPALVLALAAVGLLSMASIIAGLRHALRRERRETVPVLDPREAERRRIRAALGDLVGPPIDLNDWPEHLRPHPDLPDRDTLRNSITPLSRPIWQDIREDRDARG